MTICLAKEFSLNLLTATDKSRLRIRYMQSRKDDANTPRAQSLYIRITTPATVLSSRADPDRPVQLAPLFN